MRGLAPVHLKALRGTVAHVTYVPPVERRQVRQWQFAMSMSASLAIAYVVAPHSHFPLIFIYVFSGERHGSGDPTLCGGYPAPACSTRFRLSIGFVFFPPN
jgi:hypothetical protein